MQAEPKWYLGSRDDYYAPSRNRSAYPIRQGDIFVLPEMPPTWSALQVVHPTCELSKPAVREIQVVKVEPFSGLSDDHQRSLVAAGLSEKSGAWRIAMAHTFFLRPWGRVRDPHYANFREIALISRDNLRAEHRVAALTHDCRVTFIRRWLYFRFRILLSFDEVRNLEAARISMDPTFEGPRPPWAPLRTRSGD